MVTVATKIQEWETLHRCLLCTSERIGALDPDYNLFRCEECGYVFDNPRPTIQALVRFYSNPGKYDSWLAAEAPRQRLWKRRLKKLLKHAKRASLLDVGTGTGQFLNVAKPFFGHVAGTEVSESGIRVAKEKYGLNVAQGELEGCDLPRNSFDTITLFHVLEHVPDPTRTIYRCDELLKPGGILLICVPNDVLAWTSKLKIVGKRMGLRQFQKFSPKIGVPRVFSSKEIHLSHFTSAVLKKSLEQAGFAVIDESLDPYFSATGFWYAAHSAYYAFHHLLFHLSHLNRYDTIWMVARKEPGSET